MRGTRRQKRKQTQKATNGRVAAEGSVFNPAQQFFPQPYTSVSPNLGSTLKEIHAPGGKRETALINSELPLSDRMNSPHLHSQQSRLRGTFWGKGAASQPHENKGLQGGTSEASAALKKF